MKLGDLYRKGKTKGNRYFLVVECIETKDFPPLPLNPPWDHFPNENILKDSCHILKFLELGGTSIYNGFCRENGDMVIYAQPATIYHREDKKTMYEVH